MFFIAIFLLINLISSIQLSSANTLDLTFSSNEKYYEIGDTVDIHCELNNSTNIHDTPQLWHVDFKTNKHTSITRWLIHNPPEDAPELFKTNKHKRIRFLTRNYFQISNLQLEDSAQYECNCPDCEEHAEPTARKLQVMQLAEPKWYIEPGWPLQENTKVTIKCIANDFYPFVDYKIISNDHVINKLGKHVHIPMDDVYPHRFSWETTVEVHRGFHNTTLVYMVKQGKYEQNATKILDVLFTPRFLDCATTEFINASKGETSISCSYAGNPVPQLVWYHQIDNQPITNDGNFIIKTESKGRGKYTSILTFKNSIQTSSHNVFVAKLILSNNETDSRKISIVDQTTTPEVNLSGKTSRQILSTSVLLFVLYLIKHIE